MSDIVIAGSLTLDEAKQLLDTLGGIEADIDRVIAHLDSLGCERFRHLLLGAWENLEEASNELMNEIDEAEAEDD